jgi:hypothetical protein
LAKVIFDTLNEQVFLSRESEVVPQFMALRKKYKKDSGELDKLFTYLYLVYDRNSVYADVLLMDRKQMVCVDRLKCASNEWEKMEAIPEIRAVIDFMAKVQYTAKERLFYGVDEKVEEYLNFWKSLSVTEKNHNIVAESVVNAAKLVKLRDDLEKQVFKSSEDAHQVGGGKAKLFEG